MKFALGCKLGYKIDEEGRKTRVCKRCGEAIK